MREVMKVVEKLGIVSVALLAWSGAASAQTWNAVTPFPGSSAGTPMLRTDGNVMVQDSDSGQWYELTPDLTGSYSNGSWTALNPAPSGYAPRFYGSAVLPDERNIFEGGEYNFGIRTDTTLGAIYDELSNTWKSVTAPSGWTSIGDAPTVVLATGQFMMGDCCSTKQAVLNPTTLTWTSTGAGKADSNSEEGWTLLPAAAGNKVLTVDTQNGSAYELYNPTSGTWSSPGSTPSFLGNTCGMPIVPEMGPAVLRPNGTVLVVGGNGKTAIYNSSTGTWSAGPTIPGGLVAADAPGALLRNGHVLIMASPCMAPPASFFEYDGSDLDPVPAPPNAVNDASYHGHMLVLPRAGHILFTDGTTDVEIYTPAAGGANERWTPTISSFPGQVVRGASYPITGTNFGGASQGAAYGDDVQTATNFPLVRMVDSLGNVYYARTYNFSPMGVQTGATVESFTFVPPTAMAAGPATLVVVTNGIASIAVTVNVS